ncbi:Retrovirus-related Pol polyprotein from transposon 17.6-like protein [Drosera capensis]
MDDHPLVLGMEFLDKMKAVPIPFASAMCIVKEDGAYIIPVVRWKARIKTLSSMQLSKGVKHGEPTYLATLKRDDESNKTKKVPIEIEKVLEEFSHVMPKELPKKLPPRKEVDHQMELELGTRPYRMAPTELEKLRKQLRDLFDAASSDPRRRLMVPCYSKGRRMVTVKNKYPIPLIADLFDQLGGARYFTKLDLRSRYYQVRIAEGDEGKTTCVTRCGSFEFLVMPFGLANAPAKFCTLMNNIFHPYLNKFVVVYLDDIVVYNAASEEHVEHLRIMFKVLASNKLYVKKEKCSFSCQEVNFLGHVIKDGKLFMEEGNMRAIQEWKPPTKVSKLRSFLGLANYYRRFIERCSSIVSPLTDMLKKDRAWAWTESCQKAFEELKRAVSSEPVLSLADHSKHFEVHTDVSDFTIGGVLIQEVHP